MMIYLIDDKQERQEFDYGWNQEKINKYSHVLIPIYKYEDIIEIEIREEIFKDGNVILFHDSFFDNTSNIHSGDSIKIKAKLNKFADEKGGYVIFFSGSINSRTLDERVAHIPVSELYKNLNSFIDNIIKYERIDLRVLLYGGKNPEIEEELLKRLKEVNNLYNETQIISEQKTFLAKTESRISIPVNLPTAIIETFTHEEKFNREITQSYLDAKVSEWFSVEELDKIFIPLCFGPSLSDYNGLQFACHIRCTNTINRLKPIFIYSFVDFPFLVDNEYFNILKTKNVFLIEYTREAFLYSLVKEVEPFAIEQLQKEIKKLKLDAPNNYEDSHSIANEWAIYRWAESINANYNVIDKITKKVHHQLYFKYLNTIYQIPDALKLPQNKLKIKYDIKPNILYIDDEADKGWYEIFHKILYEINGIIFEHLDEEFNYKNQDEIIQIAIEKILKEESDEKSIGIDLVILDFRLHPHDFSLINISDITGLKLLKQIKKINPGIQVIMFSATNKIWNLQAILDEHADGFIIKESPEQSLDKNFTNKSLQSICKKITQRLKYSYLKIIWNLQKDVRNYFSTDPLAKYFSSNSKDHNNAIKYQNLILQELDAIYQILNTNNQNRFNHAMIMLYKILEYLNEMFFKKTNQAELLKFYDGSEVFYYDKITNTWNKANEKILRYNIVKKSNNEIMIKNEWINSTSNKILNLVSTMLKVSDLTLLQNLILLSEYRNGFIHSDINKRKNLNKLESKDIVSWASSITKIIKHL